MLGALLIAMSMQLDRKGLWNLLGPVLCAILLMVTTWVRYSQTRSDRNLMSISVLIKFKSRQSHAEENIRLKVKQWVCCIPFSFVSRCTEGCSGEIVTRLLGDAGSSSWSPGRSVPWSGYVCTFLPRRRTTTTTRTRCGTSWWPAAWCSCCRRGRGTGRRWAGAGVSAGAGAGNPGSVGTHSVRATRTNSTLSHSRTRDAVKK